MGLLKQSQTQKQRLSPQQILTSKLLQMNRLSIEQRVYQEMEKNVMLELAEPEEVSETDEIQSDESEMDLDNPTDEEFYVPPKTHVRSDDINFPVSEERTQIDFLLEQATIYGFNDTEMEIVEQIIYNLDERGYLSIHLGVIAGNVNSTEKEVFKVLGIIQSFDPSGIAARDLKECLIIQSERLRDNDLVVFLKNHFDDFANRRFRPIYDAGISKDKIKLFSERLSMLNPHPGEGTLNPKMNQLIPDLTLELSGNDFKLINHSGRQRQPQLNSKYVAMLKQTKNLDHETKIFLRKKLQSAYDFLLSLEERRTTIERVANAIFRLQSRFIETAGKEIIPMTMKEIAEEIQIDLSSVSRTVNGKYIQTPFGIYELRSFFGIHMVHDGSDYTDMNVKLKIKNIVTSENQETPYTDEKIVLLLETYGMKVARRTVSKYRTVLGILPARLRKRA